MMQDESLRTVWSVFHSWDLAKVTRRRSVSVIINNKNAWKKSPQNVRSFVLVQNAAAISLSETARSELEVDRVNEPSVIFRK